LLGQMVPCATAQCSSQCMLLNDVILYVLQEKVEYSRVSEAVSWAILGCIAISTVGFVLVSGVRNV